MLLPSVESAANRGNLTPVRQIERLSIYPRLSAATLLGMTKPDLTLAQIAAQFTRHSVEKRAAPIYLDRPTANAIARKAYPGH